MRWTGMFLVMLLVGCVADSEQSEPLCDCMRNHGGAPESGGVDDHGHVDEAAVQEDGVVTPAENAEEEEGEQEQEVQEESEDEFQEEATPETDAGWITLPVRVTMLTSDVSVVDSTLRDEDVEGFFAEVNAIWAQAGVAFSIESIARVEARNTGPFVDAVENGRRAGGGVLQGLYPADALLEGGFNVVYLEDFGPMPPGVYQCTNGVVMMGRYFGARAPREVPANVLAHELGHALSLEHLCGQGENLMCADGTQPTALTGDQIEAAARQAVTGAPFFCNR